MVDVVNIPETLRLHAIVFQEGEWWVGQCIEKDIAVQAHSFQGVREEFARVLEVHRVLGKERGIVSTTQNLPAPPPAVIQKIQGRGQEIVVGNI